MRLLINILSLWLFLVTALLASMPSLAVAEVLGEEVSIDHNNFTLINSRRVTRTVSEYTIRALAQNTSVTQLDNVKASLVSVPSSITIVDGNLDFGLIAGNSSVLSSDEFTIQINLRQAFSLADLVWQIEGDLPPPPPPPPPPNTSPTETGIFMSIDNNAIKGEATSSSHKDWITVLAWSEGSSNSGNTHLGTGSGAGRINIQAVNVTKWLDSSDPELRLAILTGRRFDEVKIDVIKACGRGIYTKYAITLNDVLVSSLSSGGSGGEDRLTENVSFDMSSIETMYTPVGPDCRLEQPIYSFQSYD